MNNRTLRLITVILLIILVPCSYAQKKTPAKSKGTVQKQQSGGKKPKENEQNKETSPRSTAVIQFTPEQIESFKQQSAQLVKFVEGTLNFLADKRNPVKEKQVIVTNSYLKVFWDDKVQVEDDLDEKRLVPLYKDVPAYLTDVDFFFKRAKFTYNVQDVAVLTNELGQTYFKVTAMRTLNGMTVNDDSVNSNKIRYIEINYDDSKQQLKIVSMYTTKLNEQNDMRNWWNQLPQAWKDIFGKDVQVSPTAMLSQVSNFSDSVSTVDGNPVQLDAPRIYPVLIGIISRPAIDLSGNKNVTDLSPLGKLSNLKEVNLSGTMVTDLMPLRNLNGLEVLDLSNTPVDNLEPLRYANHIRILKLKNTRIPDLTMVSGFSGMTELDISGTPVISLDPIRELVMMKDLRFSDTQIADVTPVSGMNDLNVLYFSNTKVTDISPLKNLKHMQVVVFDKTAVSSLEALDQMPELIRVFCDNSAVKRQEAIAYMIRHPEILVIFASDELQKWWTAMPADWKKVFNQYRRVDPQPTTEQLHRLATIDSINVNGRSSITTLDPVSELSEIRRIEFASTGVTDLGPLKSLQKLVYINGANSKIADVSALSASENLQTLTIDNTNVKDLTPLKDLKNIKLIYADNTSVSREEANKFMNANENCLVVSQTYENTSWWGGLPQVWKDNLMKQVKIKGNPDKIQLQQIAGLETLVITDDPGINSLEPVTGMSRLKDLDFSGTRVASLEPLSSMKSLKRLVLQRTPVADLTPISNLSGLEELDFSNTQVEDLMAIQNLTGLEVLKFSGTPVKNLKYIQNLHKLKELEFYNTRISNLDILETMSGIKSLKIFNTKISEKKVEKFKQSHPSCEVIFY